MGEKKRNEKTSHLWVNVRNDGSLVLVRASGDGKESRFGAYLGKLRTWQWMSSGGWWKGKVKYNSQVPGYYEITKMEKLLKGILGTWFQSCWGWHFQEEKLGKSVKWLLLLLDLGFVLGHCYWEWSLLHFFYFLLQNHNGNTCQGNSMISLLEECGISSVLSRPIKNLKWQSSITALGQTVSQLSDRPCHSSDRLVLQLHVTPQFCLENKGNTSSRCEGILTLKTRREEGRDPPPFGSSFYMFFFSSPCACPT